MAASLRARFGIEPKITVGSIGQFDVVVDGRTVFSKGESGRFPLDGEVEEAIQGLGKGAKPQPKPNSRPSKRG